MAVGAALALALFVAVFDWTWFRPLIQHHVHERSGRRVDFEELHVGLNRDLQPTVRFERLLVQNAPWAASAQPLIRAGQASFSLSWRSLFQGPIVVTRMEFVDAELEMEYRADGRRNWRVTRPDDRGPGRVRVQTIDARNTRAHIVVEGAKRLELDLRVAAIDPPPTPSTQDGRPPFVRAIALRGMHDATPFEAQVAVSAWPTLFDTGRPFAIKADLQAGPSHAHLDGTVADLMQLARVDIGLQADGSSLGDLGAVVGLERFSRRLPGLPSTLSANVSKNGASWRFSDVQARIGRSDLAGDAEFNSASGEEGRSTLRATLTSERIDVAGLRAAQPPARAASSSGANPPSRLDADLDVRVATIEGALPVAITQFSTHGTQREGRSALESLQFALAGGRAAGALTVDTSHALAGFALELQLERLQLAQLARRGSHEPASEGTLSGGLNARLALRSRGDSMSDLAAGVAGTVTAELVAADIPESLDAKLALNGGHLLRSMFKGGSERVAVRCGLLDMRFEQGRGEVRRFAFETENVAVGGTGEVDLGRRSVDVLLTPNRKTTALFALDRSIRVSGALAHPKIVLVDRATPAAAPARCVGQSAP